MIGRGALALIAAFTVALGLVPAVVLLANVGWHRVLTDWATSPALASALTTTVVSGLVALAIILALGLPTAWYLARRAPPRVSRLGLGMILVPLFMPPLVLGLVLAFILGPVTGIGAVLSGAGIAPTNSWFALVAAEVYEALPYFVVTAWAGLAQSPRLLEEAAQSLRRRPREVFWYVTLPLVGPSLVAALAMTWSRVVGAFGAVIVLAYHPTGLPVAIWIGLEELGLAQALPFALWLLVVGLPVPLALVLKGNRDVAVSR